MFLRYGDNTFLIEVNRHFVPFLILYLFWALVFFLFGLYEILKIKPTIPHLKRFGFAIITSFSLGIFLFYLIPILGISPKTNLFFQIFGFGLFSFSLRRIIYSFLSSQIIRPAILVGKTEYLNELNNIIENNPQIGLKVIFLTKDLHKALESFSGIKNLVFIFESFSENIPNKDIKNLYRNNIEIIDVAKAYEKYLFKIPISYISQSWIVENINTKKDVFYVVWTRIFDVIFSTFSILILSPILLIISLLIYLEDNGPILYIQKRVGLNGKVFKLFKLRSMIVNSEKDGAIWALENDLRITKIGKIIRKLHIDEIPQMINIIKGDITLVGPRPERPEFVESLEKTIPNYDLRHIIRPGFTGWAQIKYHYANTVDDQREKFEYDLYYIKNRNIFLDFGIILRTIQIIFTH